MFCFAALVITDGPQDKSGLADEVGSEDDLYNEFRSSSNRFGHPGGGGEQLAINEVLDCISVCLFMQIMYPAFSVHDRTFNLPKYPW